MDRKSIARSRRAWVAFMTSVTAFVPLLDAFTGVDLVALLPAVDKFVGAGFSLVVAGLAVASVVRPDKHGKEPGFIADKR